MTRFRFFLILLLGYVSHEMAQVTLDMIHLQLTPHWADAF